MKWQTFGKRESDTEEADHQHLSNYIWHFVGILGNPISYVADHVDAIKRRFNNKILPYRPIPWFYSEIQHLVNSGYIYLNDMGDTLIIVDKKVIGEVLKSTHPSFERLKKK